MAAADADVDINNLLQIRQGYLSKLGGGQEKGHKWNRRWCVPSPIGAAHRRCFLATNKHSCDAPAAVLAVEMRPHSVRLSHRFVLRDNVLMYFNSPKDFTGFRDKPSGVVLLEECSVREVAEDSNLGACAP